MNICIVTQQFRNVYSGVGLHTKLLVEDLSVKGHILTVIVPQKEKPIGEFPFQIITVPSPKIFHSQARWIPLSHSFAKKINQIANKNKFDLIHFTDIRDSIFCNCSIPQIANINDTYSAELFPLSYYVDNYFDALIRWGYYRFSHFFEGMKVNKLSAVIANSQYTFKTLLKNYKIRSENLYQCYKAVNKERYAGIAHERLTRKSFGGNHQILFIGGNMQRKGIIDLIKAAPMIINDFPDATFIIAGRDKFIPKYQQLCEDLGVAENFQFLGWVSQDQLLSLYQSSDLLIMPSLTEALGVVFLEAMAAAVPVIGSDVGGIPEIIEDNKNGLLVPVNDPKSIAAAVKKILNDPNFAKALAENGLNKLKKFSVGRMIDCTEKIYSMVLDKST